MTSLGGDGLIASFELNRAAISDPKAFPFCLPILRDLDELALHQLVAPGSQFVVADAQPALGAQRASAAVSPRSRPATSSASA